jgi:5-formyltetrahydrofolate cyclo-ligase
MRATRREHVAGLAAATRALLFLRPPRAIAELLPASGTVGLYHAKPYEAPTRGYGRWFYENGRHVALPWFAGRGAPMQFRIWHDPFDDGGLELGPYGQLQPPADAPEAAPALVFVPLLAFTAAGARLGQGGGHYDRWLAENPAAIPIGMAWDAQRLDSIPLEAHDRPLAAVVTPTRLFEREI